MAQDTITVSNVTVTRAPGSASGQAMSAPSAVSGKNSGVHAADYVSATASPTGYAFGHEAVGSTTPSQTIATFAINGYTGSFTPTVTFENGVSYNATPVVCSPAQYGEVCTVTVTFQPLYPGGHRDALLLWNGSTLLAQTVLYGVGDAPLALIQPGVVHSTQFAGVPAFGSSAMDDAGNLYVSDGYNTIYKFAPGKAVGGPGTVLMNDSTLNGIANLSVDGAGNLLWSNGEPNNGSSYAPNAGGGGVFYFGQTVDGGTDPTQAVVRGNTAVATGNTGYVYVAAPGGNVGGQFNFVTLPPELLVSNALDQVYWLTNAPVAKFLFAGDGDFVGTGGSGPNLLAVDPNEIVFAGGPGGLFQMNVFAGSNQAGPVLNTHSFNSELAFDAADTVYTRYSSNGGVTMLAGSNMYANPLAELYSTGFSSDFGNSIGQDGTVYVSNGQSLDVIDRSQGALNFGAQTAGSPSSTQTVQIYNGGNQTLTVSGVALAGDPAFSIDSTVSNGCPSSFTAGSGVLCNIGVKLTPTHAGSYSGTLTFTSDSLNTSSTTPVSTKVQDVHAADNGVSGGVVQAVTLTGYVNGIYVTASPNPVSFGYLAPGTSYTQTVTLTNSGVLYSAEFGDNSFSSNNGAFTVSSGTCININLAPGASCTMTVKFTSGAAQSYSGTISWSAQSTGGGGYVPGSFSVSGTGINPVVVMPPDAEDITLSDAVVLVPSTPLIINDTITVSDGMPSTVPSTLLGIFDSITLSDTETETSTATTTTLTAAAPEVTAGNRVELTATVAGFNTTAAPTGSVAFYGDGNFLGNVVLVAGVAQSSSIPLTLGGHNFVALYTSDAGLSASTSGQVNVTAVSQTVLDVTAQSFTRSFGISNPALTYAVTNSTGGGVPAFTGLPVVTTTATLNSAAGVYPITVSVGTLVAPPNYAFALVNGTLTVSGGAAQAITFMPIPTIPLSAVHALTLTAHSSSGLPVTYSVSGPATLAGSTLTLNGGGTVTVTAMQAGNSTFAAATAVVRSFTVVQ